jgi:hypothetical protein
MPKAPTITPAPYTPTRADPSIITAGQSESASGFNLITNSRVGQLQQRAMTGKTVTTGGTL